MTGKVGRPLGSRKKTIRTVKPTITKTGVEVEKCYCRKCRKEKNPNEFFEAVDFFLDTNGKMSICKDCCNDMYKRMLLSEHTMYKAILKTCRILNVRFDENALSVAETKYKKRFDEGNPTENVFGLYKLALHTTQRTRITKRDTLEDMIFEEPTTGIVANPMSDDDLEEAHDLKQFWGENFEYDDYVWLEAEYSEWKKTHKIDTRSEISLLKMIVLKLFDIRKARLEGQSTNNLEKQFQDLLKTSALSPAQSNVASQGKIADTWGMIIKMIEEESPAEHYKDQKLFDDFFNIKKYCRDYITRPITNFFSGQKNYDITEDNDFMIDDSFLEDFVPDRSPKEE